MEILNEVIQQVRGYLQFRTWWWGLFYLVVSLIFVLWPLAIGLSQLLARTHRGKIPVEAWAHLVWAVMLTVHLCLWVPFGLDSTRLAWYGGIIGGPLYVVPVSIFQYLFAAATVLPYVLLPLIEMVLIYNLAVAYRRLKSSGA